MAEKSKLLTLPPLPKNLAIEIENLETTVRQLLVACDSVPFNLAKAERLLASHAKASGDTQNRPYVDTSKPANGIAESGH
jgi:hypothetical protein